MFVVVSLFLFLKTFLHVFDLRTRDLYRVLKICSSESRVRCGVNSMCVCVCVCGAWCMCVCGICMLFVGYMCEIWRVCMVHVDGVCKVHVCVVRMCVGSVFICMLCVNGAFDM